MQLEQVTAPPVEPVTLAEAREHLNVTPTGSPATSPDDTKITRLIKVARTRVEQYLSGQLVQRTLRIKVSGFPFSARWMSPRGLSEIDYEFGMGMGRSQIRLQGGPITAVTSVRYYDTAGTLQTLATTIYRLVQDRPAYIELIDGQSWPATAIRSDAVWIDYEAGYAPSTSPADYLVNIPEDIREAVLQTIQIHYDALAQQDADGLNGTIRAILNPYRLHRFTGP